MRKILPNKRIVALFCLFFLGLQVFEALAWREDYPFTKWGMYHKLHTFEKFFYVEIRVDGKKATTRECRDPWTLHFRVWDQLGIGERNDIRTKEPEQEYEIALQNARANRTEFIKIVNDLMKWGIVPSRKVDVYFQIWKQMTVENKETPDFEILLYSNHQDFLGGPPAPKEVKP